MIQDDDHPVPGWVCLCVIALVITLIPVSVHAEIPASGNPPGITGQETTGSVRTTEAVTGLPPVEGKGNVTASLEKTDANGNFVIVMLAINGTGEMVPEWTYLQQTSELSSGVSGYQRVKVKNAAQVTLIVSGTNKKKDQVFTSATTDDPNSTGPVTLDSTLTVSAQPGRVTSFNQVPRGFGSLSFLTRSYHLLSNPVTPQEIQGDAGLYGSGSLPPRGSLLYDRSAGSYIRMENGDIADYVSASNTTEGLTLSSQAYYLRSAENVTSTTLSGQSLAEELSDRIPAVSLLRVRGATGVSYSSSARGGQSSSVTHAQYSVRSADEVGRERLVSGGVADIDPVRIADTLTVRGTAGTLKIPATASGSEDSTARPSEVKSVETVSMTGAEIARTDEEGGLKGLVITSKEVSINEGFVIGNLTRAQRSSLSGSSTIGAALTSQRPSASIRGAWETSTGTGGPIERSITAESGDVKAHTESGTTAGMLVFNENGVAYPGFVEAT